MNTAQSMGFPSRKPTRRGGRNRNPVGSAGVPINHLKNLTNAMEIGDHAKVRSHAFSLIRSLPKAQQGQPSPNDVPGASGAPDATATGTDDGPSMNVSSADALPKSNSPAKPSGTGPRLAAMLKGRKGIGAPSV